MRKMIGEMDILVAQLSSELKFIKNGMILAFFIHSTCLFLKTLTFNLHHYQLLHPMLLPPLVILIELQMLGTSM